MKKALFVALMSLLFPLLLAPALGCRTSEQATKEPIKIGLAVAVTGPMAYDGNLEVAAIELARDMVNDNGGILGGRMIETVIRDHAYDPANAVTAVNKLIFDDEVDVIIGLEDTALVWACEDLMAQQGIPFVNFGGNPPGWPEADDVGAFRIGFVVDQLVDKFFNWAKNEMGVDSLVVVGIDTTFINDSYKYIIVPMAEKYDIELKPLITYPVGAPDFMPQYAKAVSYNTDMLWGTNFFNSEIPREISAIKELGYQGIYSTLYDIPTEAIIEPVKEDAEGIYVPFMTFPYDQNPAMTEFREAFQAKTGLPPHYWSSNAWMAFWTAIHGIEEAGKCPLSLEEFDAGVKAAEWMDLQGNPATWTENGAMVYGDIVIGQVQDGKFVKVTLLGEGTPPPPEIYGEVLD